MRIIGYRKEFYIDKMIYGHNCDFSYEDEEFEKHIISAVLSDDTKVEIDLSVSFDQCYSGWTTASFGNCYVKEVYRFDYTNRFKPTNLEIDDINLGEVEEYHSEVFSISVDGGDHYYPSGGYEISESMFKKSSRTADKRKVWIFKGDSVLGKTYLSQRITDKKVLETDAYEIDELPETIIEDIIVIGNKYDYNVNDIASRLFGNPEIIIINFKKYKEDNNGETIKRVN